MPQDWFSQNAPKPKQGQDWFASNAPTAPSLPETHSWLSSAVDFGKGFVSGINPIPGLKALYEAGPIKAIQGLRGAQFEQFQKAHDAYKQGRYSEAVGYTIAGTVPLVGPAAAATGEKIGQGKVAEGLGETAAFVVPSAIKGVAGVRVAPKVKTRLTPVEQAAVEFAEREGIPLDTATRTGNQSAKGIQNILQKQPGSAGYAADARAAQSQALTRTAEKLRTQVEPRLGTAEYTAETAGQGVRDTLKQRIQRFDKKADEAYSELRRIENDPANAVEIADPRKAAAHGKEAFDQMVEQSVDMRLQELKDVATSGATEMTGKVKRLDSGEIVGRFGGGFKIAFPELKNFKENPGAIAKAIERGQGPLYEAVRKASRELVIDSEGGDIRMALSDAGLPPDVSKTVKLPVDMRPVKEALKPVADQIKQRMPIAVQQGSFGLKAIDNILAGEDFVSASVADANLSAIKSIARGAEAPELRNLSQGLAAKAVRELDLGVRAAVAKAGPDASKALQRGRSLTKAKYSAADLLKELRDEPVQVFNQLTFRKDSSVNLLREVAKQAPQDMPKLARAYLEGLFDTATKEGGFDRAGTLFNKWNDLGPTTKKALFRDPIVIKDLDNFFLIAKKIAENPNPSGTASTAAAITAGGLLISNPALGATYLVGSNALARLLMSPKGSKALTNGLKIPLGNKAGATLAASELVKIAGEDALIPAPAY